MRITFALMIANRGFFPGEVIALAREEIKKVLEEEGYGCICMEEDKTRFGAVETREEGRRYAEFLKEHEGEYQGILLSMPNFGDENGALEALKEVNVPILIQAYPDEMDKMDFTHRRDAMCGKFAMCNVLRQAKIPFSLTSEFVEKPSEEVFRKDLEKFASTCRICAGMKHFNIGAIGARTTAFKTVRVDETALQRAGINVETIDLSEVFARMQAMPEERILKAKEKVLAVTDFGNWPEEKLLKIAALQEVLEDLAKEYALDAMAIRCWPELQTNIGIAPCTNVGILNEMGIATACELDIPNAVMMRAQALAGDRPGTLLDFNNNYGPSKDKAILFHCGPMPISMMKEKGTTIEHLMFRKTFGEGTGVGVNKGEMIDGPITIGSLKTENGRLEAFVTEAVFLPDSPGEGFFGSGKVAQKEGIYEICKFMAENGYKHHVCVIPGNWKDSIAEAFEKYLGMELKVFS